MGLSNGHYLCKSLDVEFFHAHVPVSTAAEAEDGIKPFLASRSGTYIATFIEDDDQPFLDRLSNIVTGKSNLFLAYRKVDPIVELPSEQSLVPTMRLPLEDVEVLFYDPMMKRWIFTSCDPDTDLLRDRVCAGPQVHSVETDALDLTTLSSAAFHIVDENENPDAASMALPASITCNECGPQQGAAGPGSVKQAVVTCGPSGGVCSPPEENLGFARQCLCPPGQYGLFCQDHYGTYCPTLEIVLVEGVDEPPGSVRFQTWEERDFTLLQGQRGVGNTPIWERHFGSKGYTDRVEWRGGTHWTITRSQDILKISHTIAMAEDTSVGGGTIPVGETSGGAVSLNIHPRPAGLTFHAPKSAAWGPQPDFYRPFAAYQVRCKTAPLVTKLTVMP